MLGRTYLIFLKSVGIEKESDTKRVERRGRRASKGEVGRLLNQHAISINSRQLPDLGTSASILVLKLSCFLGNQLLVHRSLFKRSCERDETPIAIKEIDYHHSAWRACRNLGSEQTGLPTCCLRALSMPAVLETEAEALLFRLVSPAPKPILLISNSLR